MGPASLHECGVRLNASLLRNVSSRFRKLGPLSVGGVNLRERRFIILPGGGGIASGDSCSRGAQHGAKAARLLLQNGLE